MTRTADEPHAANFYLPDRRAGGVGGPATPPHLPSPARWGRSPWPVATRADSRGRGGVAGAPPCVSSALAPRPGAPYGRSSVSALQLRASAPCLQPLAVGNGATYKSRRPSVLLEAGRMLGSLLDSRSSTPAVQPGSPRRTGTRFSSVPGRAACCPACRLGKAGALAFCPASGRCFPLVQGRTARVKHEAVGDLLPAFRCLLVGSPISPYLTFLKTWQSRTARSLSYFSLGQAREGPGDLC